MNKKLLFLVLCFLSCIIHTEFLYAAFSKPETDEYCQGISMAMTDPTTALISEIICNKKIWLEGKEIPYFEVKRYGWAKFGNSKVPTYVFTFYAFEKDINGQKFTVIQRRESQSRERLLEKKANLVGLIHSSKIRMEPEVSYSWEHMALEMIDVLLYRIDELNKK